MTFLGDEGRDVLVVYNILHGKLTLLGPTSSVGGFFLGPIYYYFMAPFLLLFNYNPVGPAVMVALIGIVTVFLLYKICREFFNTRVAIFAAALYAISPLIVSYSRSSWNPNPLPFFSLLSFYLIYKALKNNSFKLFAVSGFLLGISMQLHYLALFLCTIVFFYILFATLYKSLIKTSFVILIKRYLFLFTGFLIGWSPFLAFEVRHGFPDFNSIYNFIFHSGNTGPGSSFFSTIQDVFFRIFGRLVLNYPPVEQAALFDKNILSFWTVFILATAALSSSILIFYFYKSLRSKNDNFYKYSLLFFWFFIGILLFGFYKKAIYDYYFAFMFPLPFILVALFLDKIFQNKKYIAVFSKYIGAAIFIIIFIINLQGIPFRYPANRQLNQMKTIADFVMTRTDAKPFNFALISGGNSDHAYKYFFTVWSHPPVIIEDFQHDPDRETVTDQLFVVCESPLPCQPLGHSLWEIAGFGRAEIVGHWKVSVVEIYKLVHFTEK
ncbi:MAG: hypothetical protein A2171_03005 [Candidatus Levybacteria bacterium RBG_13_35_9]|nr:MAG: hypothetical protein A2171_03005 [Candidatus Levybacteria bacterium RBG_13_35_9]